LATFIYVGSSYIQNSTFNWYHFLIIIAVLALYAFVSISPIFSDFRKQYLYGRKTAQTNEILPHEPGYLEQQWATEYKKSKKLSAISNNNICKEKYDIEHQKFVDKESINDGAEL